MATPGSGSDPLLPPLCACCDSGLEMICDCGAQMQHRSARDVTDFALQIALIAIVGAAFSAVALAWHGPTLAMALGGTALLTGLAREWLYRRDVTRICNGIIEDDARGRTAGEGGR